MANKILFINQMQFGYHLDYYFYCKYLRSAYKSTYLGWDFNFQKLEIDGVEVVYIPRNGKKLERAIRYFRYLFKEICRNKYDLYFVNYFPGASLLRILCWNKVFILDIRSGPVVKNSFIRVLRDLRLRFEILFFENITIVSESLAKRLRMPKKKIFILPVGSEIISKTDKSLRNEMKLLYVGTLHNRNIQHTLIGFEKFCKEYGRKIDLSYTLIGFGFKGEKQEIIDEINNRGLTKKVWFIGKVPFDQLKKYFDKHNIGVSYIPMTPYFDCQPPTKTFDYLLSGMPVIATATAENKKLIQEYNGVLICDNPEDFYQGLIKIYNNRLNYNSQQMRDNFSKHLWKKIIQKDMHRYLNIVLCNSKKGRKDGAKNSSRSRM